MHEILPWLTMFFAAVNVVLVVVLMVLALKASKGAGREVRDELRMSREEARSAGRELREEVSGGLKRLTKCCPRLWRAWESSSKPNWKA